MTDKELERFQRFVRRDLDGCWRWTGSTSNGYGKMRVGSVRNGTRSTAKAHRLSYEHFVGPIPTGMLVCHHCDNPLCVRPAHLFAGSQRDNVNDMWRKGRAKISDRSGGNNGNAKLTEEQASDILWNYAQLDNKAVAALFGVHHATVSSLRLGKIWRHLPRPAREKYAGMKKH